MLNEMTIVKDGKIIFTGEELEIFIPKSYEASNLLEIKSESCSVFGLFNCRVNRGNTKGKIETFNFPSLIELLAKPVDEVKVKLADNLDEDNYYVFRILKNAPIILADFQRNSMNVTLFIKLLTMGKLPKTIPYNQLLEIWQRNLELNGVHLNVASVVLEATISEIYRTKGNPIDKFALTVGKSATASEYNYETANVRQITSYNSVFSGQTFEDMDQMRVDGLNMTNYNKKQNISPIESIMKL